MTGVGVAERIGDLRARWASRETVPDEWVRPAPSPAGLRRDVVGAVLLALGGVLFVLFSRSAGIAMDHRPGAVEEIVWVFLVTLPLTVRRRRPQLVLGAVALAFVGLQTRNVWENFASQIALFLALYTAGAWSREPVLARWARGVVVGALGAWLVYLLATASWNTALDDKRPDGPLPAVLGAILFSALVNIVYFSAAWAFGDLARRSAWQREQLVERNADLARERDENARRAVLDERVRIARELHDVVAHHVSVMGVQAGAARTVLDHDRDAARAALTGIEGAARQAVDEMHRLLGALRGPRAVSPAGPAPGVGELADLIASAGGPGLRVEYTVVGDPVPVPSGLAVSLYRIVQEALTNTRRHAAATRVDVRLRYLTDPIPAVEAEVVDDGRAAVVERPTSGPAGDGAPRRRGMGLIGMRERVDLHAGVLDVGPRPGGGFRVRVRFPLESRPAGVRGDAIQAAS